jgi:energy-converting hydrogenase A subunit M
LTINDIRVKETNFTRDNKLNFPSIVLLILHLFKESVEFNLATFLPLLGINPVTGAAFSIARYKIKLGFFLELNVKMQTHIASLEPKRWKGFRVIAGDGATVNLPASTQIKEHFGIYEISKGNTHICLANACILYDVCSNLILDAIIAPFSIGESTLMHPMLTKMSVANAIVLLDRGFSSFSTCKALIYKQSGFCIRLKSDTNFAKTILSNPSMDYVTTWTSSDMEKETCKKHQLDTKPIQVRVTKVILNTGEIELLVSSLLDMNVITEQDMQVLYDMRWGIEEGIKKLKPKMKLEQFSCKCFEGVYQEFYVHLFMMNVVTLIGNQAEEIIIDKTKQRVLVYKYNWQNAFRFVREKVAAIFHLGNIAECVAQLIVQISASIIAVKPNRNFARRSGGKRKPRYTQCYK